MEQRKQLESFSSLFISTLLIFALSTVKTIANDETIFEEPCPVDNNHCNCSGEPFNTVHCYNINDVNHFHDIYRNLGRNAIILELDLMNFEALPMEISENSFLMSMIVRNSIFVNIFSSSQVNATDITSNIHHLSIENVMISEWSWSQLSFLKKLDVLFIYNTSIGNNIASSFNQHMSKAMKLLSIHKSNVSAIERDCFKDLNNLTYLRISHSKLKTLRRNMLPSEPKLEMLKLDHNEITSLDDDAFEGMVNLSVVSLSNNRISTLPERVYRPIWKSNIQLDLRNNPIKCDCRIKWIVISPHKPIITGTCANPKRLHGRNISDLTSADFNC